MIKRLDRYIIGKYLTTFFVAIFLILLISIAFDISEKLDAFLGRGGVKPTFKELVFDYYLNFVAFFSVLFSPLFAFISVIFFTSRMAARMELISILDTGTSFQRLLRPFLIAALVIASLSWTITNYILPGANEVRIGFERKFISRFSGISMHFHREINPGEYIYVERFDSKSNTGNRFAYEKVEDEQLVLKIMSHSIHYDSLNGKWILENYIIRDIMGLNEKMRVGSQLDTVFDFKPKMFVQDLKQMDMMTNKELNEYIRQEKKRGSKLVTFFEIEKHNRNASPFSTIILTLLAVPIASRKVRGGIGFHLALGVGLAFTYIFMQKVTTTYATKNLMSPLLAVWLPNILYSLVSLVLIRFAQK